MDPIWDIFSQLGHDPRVIAISGDVLGSGICWPWYKKNTFCQLLGPPVGGIFFPPYGEVIFFVI